MSRAKRRLIECPGCQLVFGIPARPGHARGEKNGQSKLAEAAVKDILSRRLSLRRFAAHYGINKTTVQQIQARKTWRHVEP